ncbi:outer membrane protein assembly factor BamB [Thiomicrospira microaerophila]|uniref:outer membrane protein assembly factor BamB n=1 Tax=Thiomicrospira microaerophila TaxID=406020 RepID=UPI00200D3265|nr:outer membrane protein assembly factor BamB [Thiomicrospira microaerophila]UQB41811.1 outer membrane protein assembly factor BamB [Thiomicrospira microaerophila]
MKNIFLISALASVFLIQGCSSTSKTVRIPTELQPVEQHYQLGLDWQVNLKLIAEADGRSLRMASDDNHLYVASSSGLLTALIQQNQSRHTDQIIWQKRIDAALLAGPVVVENKVIVGSAKGDVIAFDAQTGQVQWIRYLAAEVVSQPVIANQLILVRTNDGRLVALNLQTGSVVWTADHQMPSLFLRGAAPVLVDRDRVYIGRESGFLEARSLQSGEIIWDARVAIPSGRTDLERMVDIQAKPVLADGRLFVLSYNGRMAAINPSNGNLIWAKELSGFRDFKLHDKVIYLVDQDDILRALDPATGTEYWNQQALKYRGLIDVRIDHAVSVQPQLMLADRLGYLHWIDPKDGTILARFKHANHLDAGQEILDIYQQQQRYYLLDADGNVSAYRFNGVFETRPGRAVQSSKEK